VQVVVAKRWEAVLASCMRLQLSLSPQFFGLAAAIALLPSPIEITLTILESLKLHD
jgi:hypothetical protein